MEPMLEAFLQTATLSVLLWSALGAVIGIITGALPGLTATMGMALMLPIVFQLPMVEGVAMLLSVYAGAVSGASIPAILLGIPGNPNAIATIEDGQQMTKQGMAGQALGAAAIASFIGGVGSLLFLVLFAPLLARLTLLFGPAELAALYLFGLTIIVSVSGKHLLKGIAAGIIGVMPFLVKLGAIAGLSSVMLVMMMAMTDANGDRALSLGEVQAVHERMRSDSPETPAMLPSGFVSQQGCDNGRS